MELTSLKKLTIESAKMYLEDWEMVWTALSSRLTSLSLGFIAFCERGSSSTEGVVDLDREISLASLLSQAPLRLIESYSQMTTTAYLQQEIVVSTIEKLKLRYISGRSPVQQFEWIQACPRIRSLTWMLGYEELLWDSDSSLLGLLMGDTRGFPELTYLELEEDNHEPDEMLAFLVTRTPGYRPEATSTAGTSQSSSGLFRGLDTMSNTFDSTSWIWMTSHLDYFKTTSVLNFANSPSITGAMAQEMLCCLPNLKSFSANDIQDRNIWDDPRPWVCFKLERLLLNFQLASTSSAEDTPRTTLSGIEPTVEQIQTMTMFLQRISGLKYLKLLDLSNYGPKDQRTMDLDLRLGHGLEQLSSLQELEEFIVQRLSLNLEEAEMEWMVRNWPRFRTLEGTIHQAPLTDLRVREHIWRCRRQTRPNDKKHYIFR